MRFFVGLKSDGKPVRAQTIFRKIRKHSGGGLDSHAKEIFFCTVPLEVDVEIDKYWEAIGKTTTVVGGRSSVVSDGSDCDPLQLATTGC